ncbi:MAG: hypothetical protein CM15mV76_320 [uncultured marine virus]|nr:MAG: hypothetical protein CM15mV76_320 [uncultured marine virus]
MLGKKVKNKLVNGFRDPEQAFFTDEKGNKVSYIEGIKKRADELKNKKIFSKQSGEQRFGGFLPIEDATTENLVTDEEIINDNINNNN